MWRALPAIRAAIEAREDLLVALIEGEGAHFSAGADISEFDEVYRDAAATRDYGDAVQDGLKALMDLDRPTIAVIRGVAIGGGLGLALACDLRFCAADAHLAMTPANLASSMAMPRRAGWSSSSVLPGKDLLFTARRIETDEALVIGLIDRRIETALEETVVGYARGLAELSQVSVRGCKRGDRRRRRRTERRDAGIRALTEAAAFAPQFAEGRAAFAQKRTPKFAFRGPNPAAQVRIAAGCRRSAAAAPPGRGEGVRRRRPCRRFLPPFSPTARSSALFLPPGKDTAYDSS